MKKLGINVTVMYILEWSILTSTETELISQINHTATATSLHWMCPDMYLHAQAFFQLIPVLQSSMGSVSAMGAFSHTNLMLYESREQWVYTILFWKYQKDSNCNLPTGDNCILRHKMSYEWISEWIHHFKEWKKRLVSGIRQSLHSPQNFTCEAFLQFRFGIY